MSTNRIPPDLDRRLCVAPMMGYSHRHARRFWRLLCADSLIYTEMIPAKALLNGDRDRLLGHCRSERPLALQLGGSDPAELASCAAIAEDFGYDEVNLNVGCPSGKVRSGNFGACLMAEPALVSECVSAMRGASRLPVTVKCRLGIDDMDTEESLDRFVSMQESAGSSAVVVHARKALLGGLSPKGNRTVPPLDHERVHRLKRDFPNLPIVVNGGVCDVDSVSGHLQRVDGVMVGRIVLREPYFLAEVAREVLGHEHALSRKEALVAALRHCATLPAQERRRAVMPLLGLYRGQPGARAFRRKLSSAPPALEESLIGAL